MKQEVPHASPASKGLAFLTGASRKQQNPESGWSMPPRLKLLSGTKEVAAPEGESERYLKEGILRKNWPAFQS